MSPPIGLERVELSGNTPVHLLQAHLSRYVWAMGYCPGKRVLDVGCGVGYGSWVMKVMGGAREVVGIDPHAASLRYARRSFSEVHYGVAKVETYEPEEPFEVITAMEVVEHCGDVGAALDALRRLLTPGGVLLASLPLHQPSVYHHGRNYGYAEWYGLVSPRFLICDLLYQPVGGCLGVSNVMVQPVSHLRGQISAWPASPKDTMGHPSFGVVVLELRGRSA